MALYNSGYVGYIRGFLGGTYIYYHHGIINFKKGPHNHKKDGFLGPNSILVVYEEPLGMLVIM